MPLLLRRYLYFTVGITGAAVLVVEILGAKLLSPYLGTSHFVWTAQITTTLIALALGYYVGGRAADRKPHPRNLYFSILGAALWLALTISVAEPVAYYFLKYSLGIAALATSLLLFFVPLTLLAFTSPFLIRILASSVQSIGSESGKIFSLGTIGSVTGSVLIGYVLIPFLPNSTTMFATSAVLAVTAIIYFLRWGKPVAPAITLGVLTVLLGLLGVRIDQVRKFPPGKELYRANSNFGLIQVFDTAEGKRFYLNDFLVQNSFDPIVKKSNSLFTYMLHDLAKAYNAGLKNVLCIGLGVGIVPMEFAREGAAVDVVEINPAVVRPAHDFFDMDPSKIKLHLQDGREFVNHSEKKYDAVILDAFLGDSSPVHLMSKQAFTAINHSLNSGGVLVINAFGSFEPGEDFFMKSLHKTLGTVFKYVRIHASGNGNVFFVATDAPMPDTVMPPLMDRVPTGLKGEVQRAFSGILPLDSTQALTLTDDYNPLEFYDAKNRESFRRRLALSMRSASE